MNNEQRMVRAFHDKFNCTIGPDPALRDAELSAKLILEEAGETVDAMGFTVDIQLYAPKVHPTEHYKEIWRHYGSEDKPDLVEVIDGLCDLIYVAYGAAIRSGVDLEPFFLEVHRSNMNKVGGGIREDGKIIKPEGWEAPNIAQILYNQIFDSAERTQEKTETWWASRPMGDV